MSLSMKDKSNRKKRYILAGIFLGIAALLGIERCVNDEPEPEQIIEQKTAGKASSPSTTPCDSSSLDKTKCRRIRDVQIVYIISWGMCPETLQVSIQGELKCQA